VTLKVSDLVDEVLDSGSCVDGDREQGKVLGKSE